MSRKIISYDLGTGGIKASLYDENGKSLAYSFVSYKTYYSGTNIQEQKPQDWWMAVVDSTKELISKSGVCVDDIVSLAISGHSLGVVPVDANGNLLREQTPIWSDKRASQQAARFFEKADYKEWYMATGNGFPAECYSIFKIMWYAENEPHVYEKISKIIGTKDYCNYRFTGRMVTDYSYASGSGVFSLKNWCYDQTFVEMSGINPDILPEIIASDAVVGTITAEASKETGLPQSVKVICGGVDNSCMALGSMGTENNRVYTSLGSSAWIALTSDRPVLDFNYKPYVFAHVIKGMYASATSIFSAGTSFQWMKNNLCLDLAEKQNVYELMTAMAEKSPVGANGILFNPSLAGGSMIEKSPNICGSLSGLSLSHTRADIIRAAMEGIALNLRTALDILKTYYPDIESMLIVGGGSKSPLWRKIFADVYGMPILKSSIDQDAASLGAAALAAIGAGIWTDYSVLDTLHVIEDRALPDNVNIDIYNKKLKLFALLAADMSQLGDEMVSVK